METSYLLGRLDVSVDSLWGASFEGDPHMVLKYIKEIQSITALLEKEMLAMVSRDGQP